MSEFHIECVLKVGARLGESPTWSTQQQALFWLDQQKNTVNRFDPRTGDNRAWNVPALPAALALRRGDGAIIAAATGYYDIDFGSGTVRKLADAPYNTKTLRFNDGKSDRQGRFFWVGAMPGDYLQLRQDGQGALYRFDGESATTGFAPITISNGIAFSPDGKTMYRAETIERVIYAFDYDRNRGEASGQRVFSRIPEDLGVPDGAAVDTEGGYWIALPIGPNGGSIARFTPTGKLDINIETPVAGPTMVAFGGADMSTLYITSLGDEALLPASRPNPELDGNIFAVQTSFTGVPDAVLGGGNEAAAWGHLHL